jgi:parallel beta-helix repeat protein
VEEEEGYPRGMPTAARRSKPRRRRLHIIGAVLVVILLGVARLLSGDRAPELERPPKSMQTATGDVASRLPAALRASTGATRYVAPSGDDTGPGTSERPWATLQRALDALQPGERALVAGGTYTADLVARRGGTREAPITLAARPGERVVLRPAATEGDTYPVRFSDGAAYIRFGEGFTIEGASGISSTNVYFEGDAHDIELVGNEIHASQDQGVFSERTTANLHILANRVHDNGRGHVAGQHQSHGLYIEGRDHLIANNLIQDHPEGFGIQLYPSNHGTMVVNNTIVASGHSGIVIGGSDGVSDIIVRNNIVAGNEKYGVEMDSSCPQSTIVEGNVIRGNGDGAVDDDCDAVSTGKGNIEADPSFLAPTVGDYRLRPGSPAIDRGIPAYTPRRDLAGRRRGTGNGYDIGAYEAGR